MEINKNTLHDFRQDFKTVISSLEEQYGVNINIGNITYNEHKFTTKVEVVNSGCEEQMLKEDFEINAKFYGLKPSDFGKTFTSNGKVFTITQIKTKNRTYPIIATDGNRQYKFDINTIKAKLGYYGK